MVAFARRYVVYDVVDIVQMECHLPAYFASVAAEAENHQLIS